MKAIYNERLLERIRRQAQLTTLVETPKGSMSVYTLTVRRGLYPKEYRYSLLPNGKYYPLDKAAIKHINSQPDFIVSGEPL